MSDKINIDLVAGKAGTWYTLGNILLKGCIFLTLPIFTRLLSTSDFGVYNTYIAFEGIFTAILGLGLYGTVKNAKLDFEKDFNKYLSSVLSLSLIFLCVVVILANLFYNLYSTKLGFSRFVTNCLIFQSFGSYLIFFYGAKLNIEFRYKSYIAISCFNTIGNVIFSLILILFIFPNERYLGRIIGSAIPLIVLSVIISVNTLLKGRTFYKREYWKYACAIGLPLIPHVVSQSLLSQIDRIMINDMVGKSEAGIYSYIYTICTITYVLASSFDNAWTPWVYIKLKGNEEKRIYKAADDYIKFFAVISLGFICVMPEITKIVASEQYWSGTDLLVPLTLANYCVFLYMLPVGIEYFNKKTKYISFGTLWAALLNFIMNYFAIKVIGYKAAAYTTLVSYFVLFIFHWVIATKFGVSKIYCLKNILLVTGALFVLSFSVLALEKFIVISLIVRYSVVVMILIGLWKDRVTLINVVKGKRI